MRVAIALLVGFAVLVPAAPASADVTADFALGILTVNGDGDANTIVLACEDGDVLVNDAAPSGGSVRCSNVESILVRAGEGADRVVLTDVGRTAFDILIEVGLFGEGGNDELIGSPLFDRIDGGSGADTLRGGDGADTLLPAGGGGALVGGEGVDRAVVSGDGDWLVDDDAIAQLTPVSETTSLQGVEAVTVLGGPGANSLEGAGFSGRLVLDGRAGDDVLRAGSGADLVFGKHGDDRLFAGPGNDVVEGAAGADDLNGGQGNDQLRGGSGADTCLGGPGADSELSC